MDMELIEREDKALEEIEAYLKSHDYKNAEGRTDNAQGTYALDTLSAHPNIFLTEEEGVTERTPRELVKDLVVTVGEITSILKANKFESSSTIHHDIKMDGEAVSAKILFMD
jgi:hypothetical protein